MTSQEKLQELFPLLEKQDRYENDLVLKQPDEDEDDYYICCEQIIIRWNGDKYDLRCLYNSFKTVEFETKEEVAAFYETYLAFGDDTPRGEIRKEKTNIEIAQNVGIIARLNSFLEEMQPDFDSRLARKQIRYSL